MESIRMMKKGIKVKANDPNQASWDCLIDQIVLGNVIPVICPEILMAGDMKPFVNPHQVLLDTFSEYFELPEPCSSFSELMCDKTFLNSDEIRDVPDNIYSIVSETLHDNKEAMPPSILLKDILSIKQFPFVITTSFTSIVEDEMRKIWGEELKVIRFDNDPQAKHDIAGLEDMRKPTIFYMMGRAGDGAHKFVLTDEDMLDFCASWVADTNNRPSNFVNALKDKYLLVLGNSYADWLFRFIWYSMRRKSNGKNNSCYSSDTDNDELQKFLKRCHTFMQKKPDEFVSQIKHRLEERIKVYEETKFDKVERDVDVFISYSRSDEAIAKALYDSLTARGKRVWYDRNDISYGDKFMDEITKGIQTAKYFIPILSQNIEKEKNDPHVYRQEWETAMKVAISLGRTYIIPISEKGIDFKKSSIPEAIQQHHIIDYSTVDDMENVADEIIHTINQN